MKNLILVILCMTMATASMGQSRFNLDFEKRDPDTSRPLDWDVSFVYGGARGYLVQLDSSEVKSRKYSLTILSDPENKDRSFGACAYVIPATYDGNKIELRGYMKTQNVSEDGAGGLWLRLDGESGMLAFENMQKQKINGTHEWKEYIIELPLKDKATKINVGGLLKGTGQIWIDDLRLFIDGKPIEEVPVAKEKVYPASQDSAFWEGSGIGIENVNARQVKDLCLLGKVWGFVKYYHPQVALGKINMDAELFRILPQVLDSKNSEERDQALLHWIGKMGEIPTCKKCKTEIKEETNLVPDLEWMSQDDLSEALKEKLQFILKNRNQGKHYYIDFVKHVGNPIFNNEEPYKQFEYPDAGYRVLALYRYWNIIHYFFPYKYAIEENWNDILAQFVPAFVEASDALAYRLALLKLIGSIHDTHANIWSKDSILVDFKGKLFPAIQVKFVEDKAIVTGFYNEELGKKSGLKPGDEIISVNGISIAQLLKERLDLHPASNYPTKLRDIARNLLRGNEKQLTLTVFSNAEKKDVLIERYERKDLNLGMDWAYNKPDSCYRFLNDSIGYIYLGNIKGDLLPTIFESFEETKGIVIDIRNYPSEFMVFSLSPYINPKSTAFVKFTNGDLNYPGLFHWTKTIKTGGGESNLYKGKVIVLINEMSQSQAEYTTMAFRSAPNVTVLGSTTAGADGNVSVFYLPGNLRTMISGIGVYYPDGSETQRVGIIPDIKLKPTIEGIRQGRDELLEKAMEVINLTD